MKIKKYTQYPDGGKPVKETKAETLRRVTGVLVSDEVLAEVQDLEVVRWKSKTWGMDWSQLATVVEIWMAHPREVAIAKLEALLRPVQLPSYESVMREAE